MAKIGVPTPQKTGPFIGPSTFMNIPHSTDFSKASAVVLGVPYDGGLHPTRIGSRTGPAAIREQSQLVRPFQPPHAKFNPLELLNVVDCGDADTTPSIIGDSFKEIEEAAHLALQLEFDFIDKVFEMGDLENLTKDELKNFINSNISLILIIFVLILKL